METNEGGGAVVMNVTAEQLMAVGMSRADAESEVWRAALAEPGRRAG
jgi:hypothetical protein